MTQARSADTPHLEARAARHGPPEGAREPWWPEHKAAPLPPCRPEGKLYE